MNTSICQATLLSLAAASALLLSPWATGCAAAAPAATENLATIDNTHESPRLYVRGAAELQKPADQLQISIGVVTQHADPSQALSQNSRQMQAVINAVERVGLSDEEYQTGRFQIRPVWSQRPPRQQADSDWRPEIVAYNVTNTVQIKTKQLRLAGELIQAANKAGANTIDSIQFTLADPRVHRAEAIAVATANARSDARALAEAAGVRLEQVVEVRLDDARPLPPPSPMAYDRAMAMEAEAAPPITPGDVTVRASVNLVYQIAPER